MASTSTKDEDSVSKHIVDYYKKFSQNRDLPKYFSGTSISYLPEIKNATDSEEEGNGNVVVNTNIDIVVTPAEDKDAHVDNSPDSSLISSRKLEWDNGADIGYDNCQPERGSLLPIMKESDQEDNISINKGKSEVASSSGSNVKLIIYTHSSTSDSNDAHGPAYTESSSSSSFHNPKKVFSSSSSSAPVTNKIVTTSSSDMDSKSKVTSFKSTLSFLKRKIGMPDAQSTPYGLEENVINVGNSCDTPVAPKTDKPIRRLTNEILTNAGESSNSDSGDKVQNKLKSVLKKPNVDSGINKTEKKVVTLCLTKPLTVECTSSPHKPKNKVVQVKSKQSTVGIQTDNISEKELIKIIAKTQDAINQSVIYYEHSTSSNNMCGSQTSSDVLASNCDSFEYVKNMEIDGRNNKNQVQILPSSSRQDNFENNASIECNPQKLASVSDKNDSSDRHLKKCNIGSGADIEKNIELLQKLLKSKKYDSSTQRRYIRKIIKNITESKFFEDSSTSSELFFPKKSSNPIRYNVEAVGTDTSSEGNQYHKGKVQSKLAIKTFSHNISPRKPNVKDEVTTTSEIIPVQVKEFRKNLFTLTNNEFYVNQQDIPNSNEYASIEKQYDSSSSARSYQNWKEDKTLSEKNFEVKHSSGDGNSLGVSEDNVHQHQLVWIDNEIQQLEKMKKLLTKSQREKNSKKTTSVYRVEPNTPSIKPRKYVIETQLNGRVSKHINYNINGKKYSVQKEDLCNPENDTSKPLMGDIEVESSDTTMKIKVTTFCQVCKRSPCVCITEFLDGLTNPFENPQFSESGNQGSCSCASKSSSTKTVCLVCHKKFCICKSRTSRRCSICNASPCSCSSSYAGQFLSAKPKKPSQCDHDSSSKSSASKSLCSKCGKLPCCCRNTWNPTPKELSRSNDSSDKSCDTKSGSLRKVFANCACNTEAPCKCDFVEKLLKHFNVKSTETIPSKVGSQGHIGIQTSFETENKNSQSYKNDEDKISQTDAKSVCDCKAISVQTQLDCKSQKSQTVNNIFDTKIVQTEMLNSQLPCEKRDNSTECEDFDTRGTSTFVKMKKTELASQNTQTDDITRVNVAEQTAVDNGEVSTNTIQQFDKFINTLIKNRGIRKTCCSCTQTQSATYPMDKKSQDRMGKDEKKIKFIGSDTELVKSQRKQSIGCNCNIKVDFGARGLVNNGATIANHENSEKQVKTSSVGTCRCGFSDKVYSAEVSEKTDANADVIPDTDIGSASSSTNSGTGKMTTSDTSSTGPSLTCISCDQRRSVKSISIIMHNNREIPLCKDCLEKRPMLTSTVSYTGEQSSKINSDIDTKSLSSKNTTMQTDNDEYCTCTKPTLVNNSRYCSHCLNRLRKTVRNKNSIAYTLTLENTSPSKFKSKKRKKKLLEEIKVKVPGLHGKKRLKDSENFNLRTVNRFKKMGRSTGDENNRKSNSSNQDSTNMENNEPVKIRRGLTLQDYLKQNRPDFFNSAEFRRQTVNDYRVIRELTKDQVKLKFLEERLQNDELNKHRKLFSEKEMKEITKKNYKKLPEVQQKLTDERHKRLRTADKFIVDTFAKKIQRSVLKGKRDFPLDTNIVSIVV